MKCISMQKQFMRSTYRCTPVFICNWYFLLFDKMCIRVYYFTTILRSHYTEYLYFCTIEIIIIINYYYLND